MLTRFVAAACPKDERFSTSVTSGIACDVSVVASGAVTFESEVGFGVDSAVGVAFVAATFGSGVGVGAAFVTGFVTSGKGAAFCAIFDGVFDFVEDVFLFEITGANSDS